MSGKDRYLIDTNILIYFLEGEKQAVSFFKKIIDEDIYISLINKAEETIRIRKKYRLKLPDAFICATSIIHDTTLVSRNEKDFIRVNELKFLNPYQSEMK